MLDKLKKALKTDDISELKILLAKDKTLANSVIENGLTPIFFAQSKGACEVLTSNGANLEITVTNSALTPLIVSVMGGRKAVTTFLLTNNINVNYEDASGRTALFWALEKGASLEAIKMLVDGGADVNCTSSKTKKSALGYFNEKTPEEVKEYISAKIESHKRLDQDVAKYQEMFNAQDNRKVSGRDRK